MPINRRSVTLMSATGTEMNKISDIVKGDSYYGYTDGIHTIQVIYNQFVGRFRIQATLSLDPAENDWFDIVVDPNTGLYAGSTPWNENGYVQFNSMAPADNSQAYTFQGNYAYVRTKMDREHIGDGVTYDESYGQISRVILSS
jgi:hypothetical protein